MRSPSVFGIFSVQMVRFLAEIYDFEQFSWAPVQDFSKNTLLLDRYLRIFSIFPCFLCFNQVLAHYLWYIRISLMFFWWFFNFWMSFADFGWIWSKIQHCFDAFSQCVRVFYCANLMIFSGNLRFRAIFVGSSTGFFEKYAAFGALLMYLFDFQCFSCFDQLLGHYLWCFEISSMFFWWFFNFCTNFADFGWIWSKI